MIKCPQCNSRRLTFDSVSKIYKCKTCEAAFDMPVKSQIFSSTVFKAALAIITVLVISFILFLLSRVLSQSSAAMKPAIYLYTPKDEKEKLKLKVKGAITTRIPFREGVSSIIWDNLSLKEGKIFTNNKSFDYLFYESKNIMPKHENTGWVLKRQNGVLSWNNKSIDKDELSESLRNILAKYGLFDNEINDFIEYWLDADMKIFFGKDEFTFGIFPIAAEELDRIFTIETQLEYLEYVRVQFLLKEIDGGQVLEEPEIPKITRSEYALHEWGIVKG